MSVKIPALKKTFVVKFYGGIRIYFAKQREVSLFYLTAEKQNVAIMVPSAAVLITN